MAEGGERGSGGTFFSHAKKAEAPTTATTQNAIGDTHGASAEADASGEGGGEVPLARATSVSIIGAEARGEKSPLNQRLTYITECTGCQV